MNLTKYSKALACLLACSLSSVAGAYSLPGTIHDHVAADPDFQDAITGVTPGMLAPTLGADGLPDYIGSGGYGGVSSAASFDHWWTDSEGSTAVILELTDIGGGLYSYSNSAFFPIDGKLSGNEGFSHNYHFTMHLEGTTSFKSSDIFNFTGDDDLWVFINDQLVMDLGGVHGPASASFTGVDLLGAGLLEDTLYDLDIFFAERHTTQSNFHVTTSLRIKPVPVPEPGSLAVMLAGVLGLGSARLLRKKA